MNVLYLTANPNRASSNVPTEGWFRLMAGRGLNPVLASHQSGAFQEWTRSKGIPTYHVRLPFFDRVKSWEYVNSLWRLVRIVRRHRIQMVHAIEHNIYPIAGDLARLCRLPIVVGIHCRIEPGFGRWAFGGWRRPTRLFFLSRGSQRVCAPAVDGIVPKTSWRLLYNGLDIERFRPDSDLGGKFRSEFGLHGTLIGAASWLRPGKQLEHLFAAAAQLSDRDVTVVLAGGVAPGEEDYAASLLALGQQSLGRRLRYLGNLADLRGFYNALDLLVNTSREETCSISIMESLACGCPVVGYPSVSVDEQVLPSGGEIVEQDNLPQLAGVVRNWCVDSTRRAVARQGARLRAETDFDVKKVTDQLWSEYVSVLQASMPTPNQLAASR
jgi:glycosyltransferase involved in cell wall biosynthesis